MTNNDNYLHLSTSPTRQTEPTNAESYFWRVTEGNDHEYNNYDDAVKEAQEIALKSVIDFDFYEQESIYVEKHSFGFGLEDYKLELNPLRLALSIAKLTIAIYKIENVAWELSSDEIVKLNELKKQLKEIIEL